MTVQTVDQVSVFRSALYDGTNADELLALFGAEKVSEIAGVLTYRDIGTVTPTYTANVGERIHWNSPSPGSSQSFAKIGFIDFPYQILETSSGALFTVTGSAAIPGVVLPQTQNITVTLSDAMSDMNYTPLVFMRLNANAVPSVLSGHAVTGPVTVLSTTQVRVPVISGAASLAGASLLVVAQEVRAV